MPSQYDDTAFQPVRWREGANSHVWRKSSSGRSGAWLCRGSARGTTSGDWGLLGGRHGSESSRWLASSWQLRRWAWRACWRNVIKVGHVVVHSTRHGAVPAELWH